MGKAYNGIFTFVVAVAVREINGMLVNVIEPNSKVCCTVHGI